MLHLNLLSKFSLLFILAGFTSTSGAFAQAPEKINIQPTNGKYNNSVRKIAYYYPEFKEGKVMLVNGVSTTAKLNYNLLSGEIEFIDNEKDTLAIANMQTIKSIIIDTDSFYYDNDRKDLLKLLANYNNTKLFVKEKYQLSNVKSKGAMGTESNSLPPTSSSEHDFKNQPTRLSRNENLTFSIKSAYYISDHNRFLVANKSNALKLFSEHKAALTDYIKENDTDFKSEEDLKKLLQYMAKL